MAAPSKRPYIEQAVTWIYTEHLDNLVPFYRDVLELEMVLEQRRTRVFRTGPDAFLGVCAMEERPLGTKGVMYTFLVADVQAMYEYLLTKGIEFEHPPALRGDGTVLSTFFRDPQGYHLEIQEFRDPKWCYPKRD